MRPGEEEMAGDCSVVLVSVPVRSHPLNAHKWASRERLIKGLLKCQSAKSKRLRHTPDLRQITVTPNTWLLVVALGP